MRALWGKTLLVVAMAIGLTPTLGVVFSGTLSSRVEPREVHSSADPATFTFAVQRVYKGTAAAKQQVLSAVSGASCGLEITGTGPFLVFAEDRPGSEQLSAAMCGGTRELGAGPQDALGRGQYPAPVVFPVEAAPGPEMLPTPVDEDPNLFGNVVLSVAVIGLGLLALLCLAVLLLPPRRRRIGPS